MHNLDVFFAPTSIAVIGASRTQGKVGYTILENLKTTFLGKIYPINPEANEILGLPAFKTVNDVKEPIDLAVIAVPAEVVKNVLNDCIKKKIKATIIITSGFGEISNKEAELELLKMSKGKLMILGPNCLGIYTKGLDMLFLPLEKLKRSSEGSISFISQSGAVGSALIDLAASEGVGIAKFISIGNRIDIDETALLGYLEKDLQTRAIALYLESIKSGDQFIELARRVALKKPVIVYKAGKTPKGNQATASHTGALAGDSQIYSAAFKRTGLIEAETLEDIFDFSKVLASQPTLKENKIAVVTDGGGFGIIAADTAVKLGLELPQLSKESEKELKRFLPNYAVYNNPIDLTGDADVERYQRTLDVVFKDKSIAGVVVIALFQIPLLNEGIIDVLRDAKIHGKPFVVCATGGSYTQNLAKKLEGLGIPVYPMPERAVRSMWSLYRYGQIAKQTKK